MSTFEEIKNKAKKKAEEVAEQAKNYDYKGKAEEIKTKAADIAEKAKEYDYKAKAEEIKETVKNYDYEGKAKEVADTVKNYDYEGKAKEVADTVKNYDYKAEADNIKKGGFKYFWNNYRKVCIVIFVALFALILFKCTGNKGITIKDSVSETGYGFDITIEEFINEYNRRATATDGLRTIDMENCAGVESNDGKKTYVFIYDHNIALSIVTNEETENIIQVNYFCYSDYFEQMSEYDKTSLGLEETIIYCVLNDTNEIEKSIEKRNKALGDSKPYVYDKGTKVAWFYDIEIDETGRSAEVWRVYAISPKDFKKIVKDIKTE